jgi:hypothetical protein
MSSRLALICGDDRYQNVSAHLQRRWETPAVSRQVKIALAAGD